MRPARRRGTGTGVAGASPRWRAPLSGPRARAVVALAVAVAVAGVVLVPAAQAAMGDLDPSFGSGGVALGVSGSVAAVAVQPDGRIVVVGSCCPGGVAERTDFVVSRHGDDGRLDPSFGSAGSARADIATMDRAEAVAVQGDGRIVVAGSTLDASGFDVAVARFHADGRLDDGFGSGGVVRTAIGTGTDQAFAVAIQHVGGEERVVVAGSASGPDGTFDVALARYTTQGALDTTFGSGGTLTTAVGSGDDEAAALVVQLVDGEERLVVAGSSRGPDGTLDVALARYTAGGALDTTFATGGTVTTAIGPGDERAVAVGLVPAGGVLVAVADRSGGGPVVALARYSPSGALDPAFGDAGLAVGPPGTATGMAVEADGRAFVVATRAGDILLARFEPAGGLHAPFGDGGSVRTDLGTGGSAEAVAIATGGRPVVAANAEGRVVLARYEVADITDPADVRVAVTLAPATVGLGADATSTVVVTNAGPGPAYRVRVEMPLPAALSAASAASSQGACTIRDQRVLCELSGIPPGGQATAGIVVTATAEGSFATTARVTTTAPEGQQDLGDNAATAILAVTPGAGRWLPAPAPAEARTGHTATLVPSLAKVLVVGGTGADNGVLSSVQLYEPATGRWSAAAPLLPARTGHTATLLDDHRVLVAGGVTPGVGGGLVTSRSSAVYDATTGIWESAGDLREARVSHTATLLADGRTVLVAGGVGMSARANLASAELFDIEHRTWSGALPLAAGRAGHTATRLGDGRVLVVGGYRGSDFDATVPLAGAEVYGAGGWTTVDGPFVARTEHSASLLADGRVLVAGGHRCSPGPCPTGEAELFDPSGGTWRPARRLGTARAGHAAASLPDGRVLVAGGVREPAPGGPPAVVSAELFEPDGGAGRWAPAGVMGAARAGHTAAVLAPGPPARCGVDCGRVLVVGGAAGPSGSRPLATAELFAPAPRVTAVLPATGPVEGGTGVRITGTGLGGATAVGFGSVPAAGLAVLSAGEIVVVAPPHAAGTVDVVVTTAGGTSPPGVGARFTYEGPPAPPGDPGPAPVAPSPAGVAGYWLAGADGGVFAFGDATFRGSTGAIRLNQPIVAMAPTPSGRGYWLAGADGGVFAFGDATFRGSTGAIRLNQPIVAMAPTPSGRGYWLAGADGGVFAFGDATFRGSTGAIRLNQPIVAMAPTPSGRGYWLAGADGGVFAFGDATFRGSTGAIRLNQPIVAMAPTPSGRGYWLAGADGGVFAFGDATFRGSTGAIRLNQPIVAMAPTPSGRGYWLAGADGGVFAFGDATFRGSTGAIRLNRPVVGVAATPATNL